VNGRRVQFQETEFLAGGPIGVITQIDDYDFGLPGSGILIWHIDEEVIRENYRSNRVNANRERRGVDLEEADGAQDLGRFYGLIDPGAGSENGVPEDAWWNKNPVITQFLPPSKGDTVEFGPTTMPSTAANSGAHSGIVIKIFSDIQPVMKFSVRNAFAVANFPQYAGGKPNTLAPMLADLTDDNKLDIVVATAAGEIFAWQANGQKVIDNPEVEIITQPNGLPISVPKAAFAEIGDSLFAPPVLFDLNGDAAEILAAGKDGRLRAWQASDQNLDGRADLLWQFDLGAPSRANLAVRADSGLILCGAENGKLFGLAFDGTLRWETQTPFGMPVRGISIYNQQLFVITLSTGVVFVQNNGLEIGCRTLTASEQSANIFGIRKTSVTTGQFFDAAAVVDLQNDGVNEAIIRNDKGQLVVFDLCSSNRERFPIMLPGQEKSGLAVADINNDGRKEIVLVSKNQLFAYNFNGVLTENFPLQIGTSPLVKAQYPLTPIIADANGNEVQDVIVPGVDGNVYAYRNDGKLVPGFPLAMSGPGLGSLAVGDLDRDGKLELVGVSGNGYVHVWRLPESGDKADWPMYHHDAMQTNFNSAKEKPVVVNGELMPANLVYNYPNPNEDNFTTIRYHLNREAQVRISIYDTAGDLVTEFSGPGLAQADNEVVWNLNGVQSGVYLARVEASGGGETTLAIIKIAVVK
jgi:hypothetical protein